MILFNKTRSFTRRGLDPTLDEDPLSKSLVSVIGTDNLNQASHEVVVNLLQLVPLNFASFFFFFSFTLRALFGPLNYDFVS